MAYMSEEGYKKLMAELKELETVERPKISAAIAEARDKGDLSENAEYDAAKEAQGMLEMRINKLKATIADAKIIDEYDKYRDFPALQKTTQLGIALRFGTISIRKCVDFALQHNQTWLGELIWREFFMQILYHFPKVVNQSFKAKYDFIQ